MAYSPGSHILMVNLGYVQSLLGDCEAAVDTIMPAVEARWDYPPLYPLLGGCLLDLGRFQLAREQLEESLSLSPTHPTVYVLLQALYVLEGDRDRAEHFERRWTRR